MEKRTESETIIILKEKSVKTSYKLIDMWDTLIKKVHAWDKLKLRLFVTMATRVT